MYNPAGLFNQVTSIGLAVGLASRYNKQLVIHNISNPPNSDYGGKNVLLDTSRNKKEPLLRGVLV
jgi:hypothetical protein